MKTREPEISNAQNGPGTFDEILSEFEEFCRVDRGLPKENYERQRKYLNKHLLSMITGASAKDFLRSLTPARVRTYLFRFLDANRSKGYQWLQYSLRSFLCFCAYRNFVQPGLENSVPTIRKRRLNKVPFCLSLDQITQVLARISCETFHGLRDLAIIEMLATYGVRGSQIRSLRLSDIEWQEDRILFPVCKRGKAVTVPLTVDVGNRLLAYLQLRPKSDHREVFLSSAGRPLGGSATTAMVKARFGQAGLTVPAGVPVGTHLFRHSLASRLLDHDVPFKEIADILGHRSLNSTYVYTKIDCARLRKVCMPWGEVIP